MLESSNIDEPSTLYSYHTVSLVFLVPLLCIITAIYFLPLSETQVQAVRTDYFSCID